MEKEDFYQKCAELLDTEHTYRAKPQDQIRLRYDGTVGNTYRNRWNNREPGNGRFPGHGLIRHFGRLIHVNLLDPRLYGLYKTEEDALVAIEKAGAEAVAREAVADFERAMADPEVQKELNELRQRRQELTKELSKMALEQMGY